MHQDGQYFPDFNLKGKRVLYDRIVCDVPCSGDGTIRKNPTIWAKKWSPGKGNSRWDTNLELRQSNFVYIFLTV